MHFWPTFLQTKQSLVLMLVNFLSLTINGGNYFDFEEKDHSTIEEKAKKNSIRGQEKKNTNLEPHSSLMLRLDEENRKFEIKRITSLFGHIDKLFENMQIQYQTIDNDEKLGPENYTNLYHFLSGPFGLDEILSLLNSEFYVDFSDVIKNKFHEEETLTNVVKFLWNKKKITASESHAILAKNLLLDSSEIIKLVENGIVKSKKGHLIKLSTGHTYGDPLLLFNKIEIILSKYKKEKLVVGLDDIDFPLDPALVQEFKKHEIDAEKAIIDGKIIDQLRKHFLFVSNLGLPIRFRSNTVSFGMSGPASAASVNTINSFSSTITPRTISAMMVGNHYFATYNISLSGGLFVNPLGLNFSGSLMWTNSILSSRGLDWWVYYTDSYLGFGGDYTINFDQGTLWSNGQASFLSIGGFLAGWKNYVQAGISLQTLLANSVGAGGSVVFTIERDHTVAYLERYPIDGKFASIRGRHKVEVKDTKRIGGMASVAVNFWTAQVPLSIAFRAGVSHTTDSLFRTHVNLKHAQEMLSESDIPGLLLILGKKIKKTKFPGFENPEELQEGDELVEKKIGQLSGAFVMGIEAIIPVAPFRIGGNVEIKGEFEIGLNRLPNNKFQVSIEPTKVIELGLFSSVMTVITGGYIHGISLARKQIFLFDFNIPEAKEAYFTMIDSGELPSHHEMEITLEERGPENLLVDFRTQNNALKSKGIELTYLEQTRIGTNKFHTGLNTPLVPGILAIINKADKIARPGKDRISLSFDGIDREIMCADATSVATNGLIAVRRSTHGGRISEGQGFSGRYNRDLYITHRRVYSIDENLDDASTSSFDSLLVHAQFEDTKITGNEENKIIRQINKLFSTHIDIFEEKNSKFPRLINIERELSRKDILILSTLRNDEKTEELIHRAQRATGIEKYRMEALLKEIKNKHPDKQGLIIKQFIETADGFSGFAAIHQLLGAKPEDLLVHTESGYMTIVDEVRTFLMEFSAYDEDNKFSKVNFTSATNRKNKHSIRDFYRQARTHLRHIDRQLRLLYTDKYLLDENSPLAKKIGVQRLHRIIENGIRQDKTFYKTALVGVRKNLLELLDLEKQGFSNVEREKIYAMAHIKRLRIEENADRIILKYQSNPIDHSMTKDEIISRMSECDDILKVIESRIGALHKDDVMEKMDPDYVNRYLEKLTMYKNKLNDMNAIPKEEVEVLREKLRSGDGILSRFFHNNKRQTQFRIQGTLDVLAYENEHHATLIDDDKGQDKKQNYRRVQSLIYVKENSDTCNNVKNKTRGDDDIGYNF